MSTMARGRHTTAALILLIVSLLVWSLLSAPPSEAAVSTQQAAGSNTFSDDNGHIFEGAIEAIAHAGVTKGCNPPKNDRFCPDKPVTRGELAAFLARAQNLKDSSRGDFVDDNGHTFEGAIQSIAAAGITKGCNPPKNDRFCPDGKVTRGQLAAFLRRAKNLKSSNRVDFVDDNSSPFEGSIQAIAAAGITKGCNPPKNNRFCPNQTVTRGQLAAFFARAWGYKAVRPSSGPLRNSGPIVIDGKNGTVVQGLRISNPSGPCVRIRGSANVVVRDSSIGPCGGKAIEVERSKKVTLQRLTIQNTGSGVYALNSESVAVLNSTFKHAGRNFVQFDKVTGAGNRIVNNTGANKLGGSDAEDFVSIYKSAGTKSDPLRVTGNSFRNGGPSKSGSGIMIGDYGGGNIVVSGNTLIDPGQTGIGVAGGTNVKVTGNVIRSGGHSWSNVGLYVWNQSGGTCSGIEVRDNKVSWRSSSGSPNASWNGGGCGSVSGWSDNSFGG